jgi:GDPmannose 4,6-dehydratase
VVDPVLYRPAEVDLLIGNPTKAESRLGWSSRIKFESLVSEMVEADRRAKSVAVLSNHSCILAEQ